MLYDIFWTTKLLFWNSSKEVLGKRKFPIVAFSFSKFMNSWFRRTQSQTCILVKKAAIWGCFKGFVRKKGHKIYLLYLMQLKGIRSRISVFHVRCELCEIIHTLTRWLKLVWWLSKLAGLWGQTSESPTMFVFLLASRLESRHIS